MKKRTNSQKNQKSPFIKSPKTLIISFLTVIIIAAIGSRFTATSGWYQSIKPSITPPNYVFPIAWTILYILIALSIYLSWTSSDKKEKKPLTIWFSINLASNAIWNPIFFGLKMPALAFADIAIILISAIVLIKLTWKINKTASWMLLPYILWLIFATLLNLLIVLAL
jgi:benzodiazapine receptor